MFVSVHTLIIEVSGGVVQEVYSNTKDIRVIKIDWDAGESPGDECFGGDLFVQPMSTLPPETRGALAVIKHARNYAYR
jgi:hypothetical protein